MIYYIIGVEEDEEEEEDVGRRFRAMSYQHVYTIDKLPNNAEGHQVFRVVKHDKARVLKGAPDFLSQEGGGYEVVKNPAKSFITCDCYAGLMGKQCRHIEMVLIAEDADAVGSGRYYDYDKKRWVTPSPSQATS